MSSSRHASPVAAIRSASAILRSDPGTSLAKLERDKPGHGAAELARRVKGMVPSSSKAECRRAADAVLDARLARTTHIGLTGQPNDRGTLRGPAGGPYVLHRLTPSRALGRTPKAEPSLSDRLAAFKRAQLAYAFEMCGFRHSRAWDDAGRFAIEFGGAPVANQTTQDGWIDYKSQGHRRGIVGETVTLRVPADWGTRVRMTGLAALDGLMTLDAEQLPTTGNVAVYRSTWVRQGRGVSLVTEHGYIARHLPSGATYHSTDSDPEKALRGLHRKVESQGVSPADREATRTARSAARQARKSEKLASLVSRIARHDLSDVAHVEVTRQDSLRAGNCQPGTDAFIDRYGFDGRASATIGEIAAAVGMRDMAGLSESELTLARQLAAAVLVALRRHRNARRLVGV